MNQIGDNLYPFQRKAIKELNLILKDKNIASIKKDKYDFYNIHYLNGQIFKCKGVVVNNALIYEKDEVIKKKLF